MLINQNTEVAGDKVVLVPYDEHLVVKYHQWMRDPELLETTASESLSLEEEYEMQKSWRHDENKLTFIALDKARVHEGEEVAMIGDVNLFFDKPRSPVAEVMIMVAEKPYRRKGYGRESLILLLIYGVEHLAIDRFEAKISRENFPSISLFESVGFSKVSESNVFGEVTLAVDVSLHWRSSILAKVNYSVRERRTN